MSKTSNVVSHYVTLLIGGGDPAQIRVVIQHGWQLEQAALDAQSDTLVSSLHMDLDRTLARRRTGCCRRTGDQCLSGLRKALAQRMSHAFRLDAVERGGEQLCAMKVPGGLHRPCAVCGPAR